MRAIAMIGALIGVVLVLAGILGEHPAFGAMARVYREKPSLSPAETFWVGAVVVVASAAMYAWRVWSAARRR